MSGCWRIRVGRVTQCGVSGFCLCRPVMGTETDLAIFNVSELETELTAPENCFTVLAG